MPPPANPATADSEWDYQPPGASNDNEWDYQKPLYWDTPFGKGTLQGDKFVGDNFNVSRAQAANATPVYSQGAPQDTSSVPFLKAGPDMDANLGDRFMANFHEAAGPQSAGRALVQPLAQAITGAAGYDSQASNDAINAQTQDTGRRFENMRPWYDAPTTPQSIGELLTAAAGTLTGGLADPTSLIGGMGKTALGTFARNAGVGGASDVVTQIANNAQGIKTQYDPTSEQYNPDTQQFDQLGEAFKTPEFSPTEVGISALTGGALPTVLEGELPQALRELGGHARTILDGIRARMPQRAGKPAVEPGAPATPEEVSQILAAPEIKSVLDANGITPENPRYAEFVQRVQDSLNANEQRVAAQPNTPQSGGTLNPKKAGKEVAAEIAAQRQTQEGIAAGDINPGFDPRAGKAPEAPLGDVLRMGEQSTTPAGGTATRVQGEPVGPAGVGAREGMKAAGYTDVTPEELAKIKDTFGVVPTSVEGRRAALKTVLREEADQAALAAKGPLRTSDAAQSAPDKNLYSPISEPNAAARASDTLGVAENRRARESTADNSASGTSDRPFRANDTGAQPKTETTVDLRTGTFGTRETPNVEQAAAFEARARAQSEQMRAENVADLERQWDAQRKRRAEDAGARSQYEERMLGAQEKYSKSKTSNRPGKQDADGRWPIDKDGFVLSEKGGPVKFADQKQAARWIINEGQKKSPDQNFEIHNHPVGDGFTVREHSRTGKPDGDGPSGGGGSGGKDGGAGARDSGPRSNPEPGFGERVDSAPRKLGAPRSENDRAGTGGDSKPNDTGATAHGESRQDAPGDAPTAERANASERAGGDNARGGKKDGPENVARPEGYGKNPRGLGEDPLKEKPTVKPEDKAAFEQRFTEDGQPHPEMGEPDASILKDKGGEPPVGAPPPRSFRKTKAKPVKFGANPFFDPEVIVPIVKKEMAALKKDMEALGRVFNDKGPKQKTNIAAAFGDAAQTFVSSIRGFAYTIRDRYARAGNEQAAKLIGELIDHLATDPGAGRYVKRPFEWAVNQISHEFTNRLARILDPIDIKQLSEFGSAFAQGRKMTGAMADVAPRLRQLLNEFHAYGDKLLKDAAKDRVARAKTPEAKKLAQEDLKSAGLGYAKNFFPRMLDEDKVRADAVGFQRDAADIYRREFGMSKEEARQAALDWYERELGVGQSSFRHAGIAPDATKSRVLSKQADIALDKWYVRDPYEALQSYFHRTSRFVEYTSRFGKNGEKLDSMFDDMVRAGVSDREISSLQLMTDSALGSMQRHTSTAAGSAVSWIQTIGILRLLPRAVWSSITEPMAYGARTGHVGDALQAVADTFHQVFNSEHLQDQRDIAEMFGIWGKASTEMMLEGRFGGGNMTKTQRFVLGRFFQRSGLEALTTKQRIAGVKIMQDYLARLIRDVDNPARATSAKQLLAELGIGNEELPGITKLIKGKKDGRIQLQDLMGDSKAARDYAQALNRGIDESIQNPKAVDRPIYANHPYGRLAYGIMSFMYSFSRNVLYRTGKQFQRAISDGSLTAADRARLTVGPAIGLLGLMTAQYTMAKWRDQLTNPTEAGQRPKELSVLQYLSRANAFGNLDPVLNATLGVKYERDLTALIAGSYVGQYLQDMQKMAGLLPEPFGKNSDKTNTAEWNAARAGYNAVAVPSISAALSLAPGGPILSTAYGALLASPISPISPEASGEFATMVAGKRPDRWKFQGSGGDGGEGKSDGDGGEGKSDGDGKNDNGGGRQSDASGTPGIQLPSLISSANASEMPPEPPKKKKYKITRGADGATHVEVD